MTTNYSFDIKRVASNQASMLTTVSNVKKYVQSCLFTQRGEGSHKLFSPKGHTPDIRLWYGPYRIRTNVVPNENYIKRNSRYAIILYASALQRWVIEQLILGGISRVYARAAHIHEYKWICVCVIYTTIVRLCRVRTGAERRRFPAQDRPEIPETGFCV